MIAHLELFLVTNGELLLVSGKLSWPNKCYIHTNQHCHGRFNSLLFINLWQYENESSLLSWKLITDSCICVNRLPIATKTTKFRSEV